jgi:hypothetical protein
MLVKGVAFKKSFSYAGFEQQPKTFKDPTVLCLNIELELKAEKDNAEVRVEQVSVPWNSKCTLMSRNIKQSLMPNGKSYSRNSRPFTKQEPRSSFQNFPSATSQRSTLPIATSFAQDVSPPTILTVSLPPSGEASKPPSLISVPNISARVRPSTNFRLVVSGLTCLRGLRTRKLARSSYVAVRNNSSPKSRDHSTTQS